MTGFLKEDGNIAGVKTSRGPVRGDAVILATGGVSYPQTGSDGDSHRLLSSEGVEVTPLYPSLVSLKTKENYGETLSGLSLKNVGIRIRNEKRCLYEDFGEMLFTRDGVSGPVILSGSAFVTEMLNDGERLSLLIDLKPALSSEQLEKRILRDFEENRNKTVGNVMPLLLPKTLIPYVLSQSEIDPAKAVHDVRREERKRLSEMLKNFRLTIIGSGGFDEAVVTRGGVSVREVDPGTMRLKRYPNVYCAGELLDLDALTGGFNLQIAWSTGYLAGMKAAREEI